MASKPFCPKNFPYTLVHDDLQDVVRRLRGASVKVLLFIMRASREDFTHFRPIGLSVNEIMDGSGVAHNSVSPALAQLIDEQIIMREVYGSHQGTQTPLYRYTLNLDYEPIPKNGTAIPESGIGTIPKNGTAIPESGIAPTMTGVVESQPVSPSIEQGEGVHTDHDHDDEDQVSRDYSEKDLISRFRAIRVYKAHARQIIAKHGLEQAWQWYAYVLDQENNVTPDKVERYLWRAAISNSDPPPIPYRQWEIDEIETRYFKRLAIAEIPAEPAAPAAPSNNGLGKLWATVLNELKPQIPGAFDNTLAGSMLLAITDGLAMIQVPAGAIEVCDRRLRPVVLRTLSAIACDIDIQDVKFQEVQ